MAILLQFPNPPSIRLQEIVRGNGTGVITAWMSKYPAARARFRVRVRDMQKVPRADWTNQYFRPLGGGLFEIRWACQGKQWRALGLDHKDFFVMVLGCTHKQNIYDPVECISTARKRQGEVERDEWSIADYQL
jgi:putative component of toxin-antitoxin plasmid stabilization module